MSKFIGFSEPPRTPDATIWIDRVQALQLDFPNMWAKYGPYKTENSVYSAKSKAEKYKNKMTRQKYMLDTHISREEDSWYLYIIVRTRGEIDVPNRHR